MTSIVREQMDYVLHRLTLYGVRDSDREDVAEEVFLTIARRLHSYNPSLDIRPWLTRFVINKVRDYKKSAGYRRMVPMDLDEIAPDTAVDLDRALAQKEMRGILLEALSRLDDDSRDVIVMYYIDDLTAREIAGILSIPVDTAASRVRIALEKLRRAVKRILGPRGEL